VEADRPQQLFRHGGLYAFSTLAGSALTFLALPVYVAALGKEGLGQVELLQVATTVMTLLLAQGLPAAWFRTRFAHQGQARRAFESIVLAYLVLLTAAALGVGMLIGPWLTRLFAPELPFFPLWWLSIAIAALGVFGDVYAAGLQAESRSSAYTLFTIGRRALPIALALWLVLQARWGVLGKQLGEALAALGMAVSVLVLLRPGWPSANARPLLTAALQYGLPLLPHLLALQVVAVSDRFVLHHYLGVGAVGVYGLGYRIASVLEAVNGGLGNAYRAVFMRSAAELEQDGVAEEQRQREGVKLAKLEVQLLAAASFGALALSAAARDLLALARIDLQLFGAAWQVSYIVCWGLLAHAAYAVLVTPLLYVERGTSRLLWISGAAALVNLLACIALVPYAGLAAAAWATAAAHLCLAGGAWLSGRSVWPLPRSYTRWAGLFVWHSAGIACAFQLDMWLDDWPTRIAAKAALLSVGALLCASLAQVPLARYILRRY
jgi:O-antigen/teichoic acid export membrane protein